ncbi:MAG: substrate-binding periplasmic protein [Sphingomonadaceae bacterium]
MSLYRRTLQHFFPAGIFALTLATPALAQPKHGLPCPARTITLGASEFGSFYRNGAGMDKDIAELLASRSGCKIEIRTLLRGQIWREMQAGTLDMTLSAIATPERMSFSWATPYLWMKNKIILSKDVDPAIRTPQDFIAASNLRFGIVRGNYAGKYYEELTTQLRNIARVEEVANTDQLYAMFKAGRFQAMLGPALVYSTYLNDKQARVEDWAPSAPKESANLLLSKKSFNKEEAKRWADLMKTMANDGTLLHIFERYTSPGEAAKLLIP